MQGETDSSVGEEAGGVVWVKIDDDYADRPQIQAAGPLALALQVAALCYCNKYLTDGVIPEAKASQLINTDRLGVDGNQLVKQMLEHGLWEAVSTGYFITDYFENQRSREDVLSDQSSKKTAGSKGGKASAKSRAAAKAQASASAGTQAEPQAKFKPVPVPVPEERVSQSACAREETPAAGVVNLAVPVGKTVRREDEPHSPTDLVGEASEATVVPLARRARKGSKWADPRLRPMIGAWMRHVSTAGPPESMADLANNALDDGMEPALLERLFGYTAERIRDPDPTRRADDPVTYLGGILSRLAIADVTTLEQYEQREREFRDRMDRRQASKRTRDAPAVDNYPDLTERYADLLEEDEHG